MPIALPVMHALPPKLIMAVLAFELSRSSGIKATLMSLKDPKDRKPKLTSTPAGRKRWVGGFALALSRLVKPAGPVITDAILNSTQSGTSWALPSHVLVMDFLPAI
ncbi:hypothetical protein B0H14DRAFT_2602405 [Mycena olivaceomarginata]|nr:hypothetical protein B0H14DRAFT_2602405 [Mycena olivaceomarginata]